MGILELPLELFQEILYHAIQIRGIKRGLRLRLINSKYIPPNIPVCVKRWSLILSSGTFSTEILQVIFIFRLLDPHFSSFGKLGAFALPPFAASYFEYRVLSEPDDGLPALVRIRRVAECLSQEDGGSTNGRGMREYVKELCPLVVGRSTGHLMMDAFSNRMADIFMNRRVDESDFEVHVCVAAVYTHTMAFIRRWVAAGKGFLGYSWIFGDAFMHADRCGLEMLELLLVSVKDGGDFHDRRRSMFVKLVRAGRAEATRFVFNFGLPESPWDFTTGDSRSMTAHRNEQVLMAAWTPDREVWDFITELRRVYLPANGFDSSTLTRRLCLSASAGSADMVAYLIDQGAWVNGISPFEPVRRPIVLACEKGHLDVVKILLEHHADTSGAMQAASEGGHLAIVQTLLKHGADITGSIQKAGKGGYRDIVELLLDYETIIYASSLALFKAVEVEHTALFRLLMDLGAETGRTTRLTCIKIAKGKGYESMLELLAEYGFVDNASQTIARLR